MIYIGFVVDYLVMLFLPINSYLVVYEYEKNDIFSIVLIGILLDLMYGKMFLNVFVLLFLYIIMKRFKISRKYDVIKNIFEYIVYYNLLFILSFRSIDTYLFPFISGFIIQIIYMFINKKYVIKTS